MLGLSHYGVGRAQFGGNMEDGEIKSAVLDILSLGCLWTFTKRCRVHGWTVLSGVMREFQLER